MILLERYHLNCQAFHGCNRHELITTYFAFCQTTKTLAGIKVESPLWKNDSEWSFILLSLQESSRGFIPEELLFVCTMLCFAAPSHRIRN